MTTTPQAPMTVEDDSDNSPSTSTPYLVSKALNLPQLESELADRFGIDVNDIALSVDGDATNASDVNPINLWVVPDLDRDGVQDVIAAHTASVLWNVTGFMKDYRTLARRVRSNPSAPVTDEEMRTLVIGNTVTIESLRGSTSST